MGDQIIPRKADGRVDTEAYARSQGRTPAKIPSRLDQMDSDSLSKRKPKKVGDKKNRVGGVKKRNRAAPFDMGAYLTSQQQSQNQGMQAILEAYTKSQQPRSMIRRNLDGTVEDKSQEPKGLDWFDTHNPYTEKAQARRNNINAENAFQKNLGMQEGRAAVESLKQQQAAAGPQNPNGVMSKTVNGQKFVFDNNGNPVGMTGDSGAGGKLANGSVATPEGQAQNRQGIESAFLSQMSKGENQPQLNQTTAQSQPQPTNQTQAKPAYQLPTTQAPLTPVAPASVQLLPQLPPGIPGQLFNFNSDGSLASEEQAWMNKQTNTPGQTAAQGVLKFLFGDQTKKSYAPTNFTFPPL